MSNFNQTSSSPNLPNAPEPPPEDAVPDALIEEAAPRSYVIAGVAAALVIVVLCVLGVLVISSGALSSSAQPTAAPGSGATLTVIGSVEAGAPLALSGAGFASSEQVVVFVAEAPNAPFFTFTPLVTVTAGADGNFTVTGLSLPPNTPNTFYLVARGSVSGFTAPSPVSFSGPTPGPPASPTSPATPVAVAPTDTPIPIPTLVPPTWTPIPVTVLPPATPTKRPTATPTGTPDPNAQGLWYGRFFDNRDLLEPPVFVRTDKTLKFDWRATAPGPGMPFENYSVGWTRNENIAAPNNYVFTVTVKGGARVYVDGELIINEWRNGNLRAVSGSKYLSKGLHQFRVDYFSAFGGGYIALEWKVSYAGWTGRYYNTSNLDGPVALIRDDLDINFDWGTGSPAPEVNPDFFSVDWTRRLYLIGGTYVFTAEVDDGMRLFINRSATPIMDNFGGSGSSVITGTAVLSSGDHDFEIQYNEKTGYARIKFTYARVELPPTPTPTSAPPTETPVPLPTLTPSATPIPTDTPVPTYTPVLLPTETPTETPTPELLPTETPTETPTPELLPIETPTETPTPEPTP